MVTGEEKAAEEEEKVTGKVAQILNSRQLVINRGTEHGVTVGMQFAVLNRRGKDVRDPETGEVIGSISVPKVLVKVVRTEPRLAIASTFRQFTMPAGPLHTISSFPNVLTRPASVHIETLRIDERTETLELDPKDSYVRIGDPVVEAGEDEFAGWR